MTHTRFDFPDVDDILQDHPDWLDEAIDTRAASRLTGIPVCTLNTWRSKGRGPTFMKFGAAVRYRRRRVFEWMMAREHATAPLREAEDDM